MMTLGQRIEARAKALGISQSELARRVNVGSTTINGLVRGDARWTPHLFKIARALETSAEYLVGETEDADANAAAPISAVQYVMMPVAWPSEAALEQMFAGFLEIAGYLNDAGERPSQAELARELAQQLPIGLSALQGPLATRRTAPSTRPRELATDDRVPQR